MEEKKWTRVRGAKVGGPDVSTGMRGADDAKQGWGGLTRQSIEKVDSNQSA